MGRASGVKVSSVYISQVKKAFKQRGCVSQQALAEILGLSPSTVKSYLNGKPVSPENFQLISASLGLAWEELVLDKPVFSSYQDLNNSPESLFFVDRIRERNKILKPWILENNCRLLGIIGMGGVGKTALSAKLAQDLQSDFHLIVWRSLLNAPTLVDVLSDMIKSLSNQAEIHSSSSEGDLIDRFLEYLKQNRCLIFFDNIEAILQTGEQIGEYRLGYEGYGNLLKQIGELPHQSCVIVNGREKPRHLTTLEQVDGLIRVLSLEGLKGKDAEEFIQSIRTLSGSKEDWEQLITLYSGNALALKLTASHIESQFFGNITDFLKDSNHVSGDMQSLLDEHFDRLSDLERQVLYWLAINREPVSLIELRGDILSQSAQRRLPLILSRLEQRQLVEKRNRSFTLQPVVMEYLTEQLVQRISQDIETTEIKLFNVLALLKAQSKDYIRDTQKRLILASIHDRLRNLLGNDTKIEARFKQILSEIRKDSWLMSGYAAGNILNFLVQEQFDLTGCNFSNLVIRQAFLRDAHLHECNFKRATFEQSIFLHSIGTVFSVSFSPNGSLFAFTDTKNVVHVWTGDGNNQVAICRGHTSRVYSTAFSPDSQMLITSGEDGTAQVWNALNGQCIVTLVGHSERVWAALFNKDGQKIFTGSEDGFLKIWDVRSGQCLQTLQGHGKGIRSISYTAEFHKEVLASGSRDGTVRLWDLENGRCFETIQCEATDIASIDFSPDGAKLAVGGGKAIKIWDVANQHWITTIDGDSKVCSVTFSPDGKEIAGGNSNHSVRIWNVEDEQCSQVLQGHSGIVWSVTYSPLGKIIASGSGDNSVKLWDIETGNCLQTIQGYTDFVWTVTFNPDNSLIASGGRDGIVRLWSTSTGECVHTLHEHTEFVLSVVFSPDGRMLASASDDKTVKLWDVQSGTCLATLEGHTSWAQTVSFSSDGRKIASSSHDRTIRVWDTHSFQCLKTLTEHPFYVGAIAFHPREHLIVSGGEDGTVRLWDVSKGECIKIILSQKEQIWSVAFSPDGTMVASSDDKTIRLYQVETGNCLMTLTDQTTFAPKIAFAPDGKILAGCGSEDDIRLWNVENGDCIKQMRGHTGRVCSIAFSSDSRHLVSCSEDETIKLWDVETGECLRTLRGPRPYEDMNIAGIQGLSSVEKSVLKALGAVEL
jgi:WD40 repeat protein/transcriptional regulator with XRE-family HTH domain